MKPIKIYFKILKVGNGKLLKTKDPVNNLIVDIINRNPSQSATDIRKIVLNDFNNTPTCQEVLQTSSAFFISNVADIEVIINFLPQEQVAQEQFYTQWRYVQISTPYKLVQYLDENKVVVYSEKTKVLHTVKLDKDTTIVVDED